MEADNEVIRSTFEEYAKYYSNLYDIAHLVYYKQQKDQIWMDCWSKK